MLSQRFIRVTTDPRMQGPFAWPFKVLHDLFHKPPFVADPEFSSFDIDALRCKRTQKASHLLDNPSVNLLLEVANSLCPNLSFAVVSTNL
jgi:hypothetical protein